MPKYLSNRVKRTPQSGLTSDRYKYLGLEQAEPNLGDPIIPLPNVPGGQQYQIVSVPSKPGERYWIPLTGGIQPGSITVRDDGTIVPAGGISSVTDLNFKGDIITVEGNLINGAPGTGVTITVAPPGSDKEILFNNSGEFAASSNFIWDTSNSRLGILTSSPDKAIHVGGDIQIDGTIYDNEEAGGSADQVLSKDASNKLVWADKSGIVPGAGGTFRSVQYHNAAGNIDGADNFVFDYDTNYVGIGTNLPSVNLHVVGDSKFVGFTSFIGSVSIGGTLTYEDVKNVDSIGIITARSGIVVNNGGIEVLSGDSTLQNTKLNDNVRLKFGNKTGGDLWISHTDDLKDQKDSNNEYILPNDNANDDWASYIKEDGAGPLIFKTNGGPGTGAYQFYDADWRALLKLHSGNNSRAILYGVGDEKLRTTEIGVNITGITSTTDLNVTGVVTSHLLPGVTENFDLGSQNNRWGTVYANTINGVTEVDTQRITVETLRVTGISTLEGNVDIGIGGTTTHFDTNTGKVGIGTISPDFQLHSFEDNGSSISGLFETNQTDSYISFQASGTTASSTVRIGASGDDLTSFVNGAERLRILSGGGIGIGASLYHLGDDDTYLSFSGNNAFKVAIGDSTRFYVSDTTAVWNRKDVSAGVGTCTMLLNYNDAAGTGAALAFGPSTNYATRHSSIEVVNEDGNNNMSMRFKVTDATQSSHAIERFRIASDGKVGIGSDTFTSQLEIKRANVASYPNGNAKPIGASIWNDGGDIFTGRLFLQGSALSASSDFLTGMNNEGNVLVMYDYGNSKYMQKWHKEAQVELMYNGTQRFRTTDNGVTIYEDTDKVVRFTGDIGEIGSVTGFQATNSAGTALTSFGMRATDLRFATGSEERLRITSDGKIGIGTDAPGNNMVEIHHNGTTSPVTALTIGGKGIGSGGGSGIFLKTSSNTSDNRYGTRIHTIREDSDNGASSLVISNEKSDATGLQEALRINSAGISTFYGDITLEAAGANRISMRHTSGGSAVIKNPTAANLSFGTNNQDNELTIINGGNVGIGTDNPEVNLHVENPTGSSKLKIEGQSNGDSIIILQGQGSGKPKLALWDTLDIGKADTTNNDIDGDSWIHIANDGKVGVGTNSSNDPVEALDVRGNLSIRTGDTTSSSNLMFGDVDNASRGKISYDHNNHQYTFNIEGSDKVHIDSDGDIEPENNYDSANPQDLGDPAKRWHTLYVNTINAVGGSIQVDHYETNTLKVNGISTFVDNAEFGSDVTIDGSVSIGGTLTYEDVRNVDSIGIITARSGIIVNTGGINVSGISTFFNDIHVEDWVVHRNDVATKIGFGAASEIDLQTAGSVRLNVDGSGNVSVGDFDPIDTRNEGGIHIQANHGVSFKAYTAHADSRNWRIRNDDWGWGNLDFGVGTNNTGISSITDDTVLSLTKDKRVGIGTVIPEARLHVSDGHLASADNFDSNIVLAVSKNAATSDWAGLALNSGNAAGAFIHFGDTDDSNVGRLDYNHTANSFKFFTNGDATERLSITSTGALEGQADYAAVGINTFAKFTRTGGSGPELEIGYNAVTTDYGYFGTGSAHDLGLRTNDVTRLRITTDGQLLATSAADVRLTLGSSGTAGTNDSVHVRADSANLKFMAASGGDTIFETNGTETLRILSSGNVGIGTDSPDTVLHIEGQSNDSFVANNVGTPYNLTIFGNEAFDSGKAGGGVVFGGYTNSTGGQAILGLIGAVKENNTVDDNAGALVFMPRHNGQGSGANEKMRLTSGGDLILGGHGSVIEPQGYTSKLEIHGTDYGAGISLIRYSDDYKGPQIVLGKSRNASVGLNSTVHHNDELGKIVFAGTDTSWEPGAAIIAHADDEWYTDNGGGNDNTDSPGRLTFWTTPNGLEDLEERLRIDNQGNVGIGTQVATDPIGTQNVAKLAVAGIVTAFEYYGTFRGSINTNNLVANQMDLTSETSDTQNYITFANGPISSQDIKTNPDFVFDASNTRLGIGTDTPSQGKLVAQTASGMSIAAVKDNTGASISLGGATQPRILFESDPSESTFKLYTATGSSYDSAGWDEKLRVTSGGDVGIGTDLSGASAKFQVFGTNTVLARFGNTISSTYEAISIKNTVAGYPAVCNDSSSDTLDLRSLGSVQVTVDSNNNSTGKYFRVMNNGEGGAGTELFRVGDDGNVGIGTTGRTFGGDTPHTPALLISGNDYNKATLGLINYAADNNGTYIFLGKQRGGNTVQDNDNIGQLRFLAADGNDLNSSAAAIEVQVDGNVGVNSTPGRIKFLTTSPGSNLPTERLRIDSSGKVEIATAGNYGSSPGTLSIGRRNADPGAITVSIARGEAISGGTGPKLEFVHGPDGGTQRTHSIYSYVGDLRIVADSNENMEFHTGGGQSLLIDSSGAVRIANTATQTNTSADDLIVGTTSGHRGITIFSATDGTGNLYFGDTDEDGVGNSMGAIIYSHDGNSMRFRTNGHNERLRIDSSGNVGIGTIDPTGADALTNNNALLAVGILTVRDATFDGNVSIGGTLSYESVTDIESLGIITARSNIDLEDWIRHYDDIDTKFGFPEENVFAVETAGSEALRIDSGGRVGLGSDPQNYGDAAYYDDIVINNINGDGDNSTGGAGITLLSNPANWGALIFGDTLTSSQKGYIKYDHTNDKMCFGTNGGNGNALDDVVIDSSGRTIIGHTASLSEGCLLQVARANDNTVELFGFSDNVNGARINFTKSRNGTVGTNTIVQDGDTIGELHFRAANGVDQYYRVAAIEAEIDGGVGVSSLPGRLIFSTTAPGATTQTERLRITSDGKVGINETSPRHHLTVNSGTTNVAIAVSSTDVGSFISYQDNTTGDTGTNSEVYAGATGGSFVIHTDAQSIPRVTVTNGGDVGIGITNPNATLHIQGAAATDGVRIFGGSSGSHSPLKVGVTDGTEYFRVNNDGNIGIGTDDPGSLLTLDHATNPAIQFKDSGTKVASINAEGTQTNIASFESKDLVFATSASSTFTERLRITSAGICSITTAGDTQQGTYYSTLTINNTGTSTWSRLRFDRSGVAKWGLSLGTDDKFRISNLFTNGAVANPNDDCFVISNTGKVGINKTPDESGGLVQFRYNEAYTSGTTNLLTSASKAVLRLQTSNNSSKSLYFGGIDEHATPYLQVGNNDLTNGATVTYPLLLQPYGGNIGIGTDTPARMLHLHENNSEEALISFTTPNTGSLVSDGFRVGMNSSEEAVVWNNEQGIIKFGTHNTERARIESDGSFRISRAANIDGTIAANGNGQTENAQTNGNRYWKIGTWKTTGGQSARAKLTIVGTESYSDGQNAAGETIIYLVVSNAASSPYMEGSFSGHTSGSKTVEKVAFKYDTNSQSCEVWIKYAGYYSSKNIFADLSDGYWDASSMPTITNSTDKPNGSTELSSYHTVTTVGEERLRITGNGHLLLGGTVDVTDLTGSSGQRGLVIGDTGMGNAGIAIINSNTGTGRIYFGHNTGSSADRHRGFINYYHNDGTNSDFMTFGTAKEEKIRIESDGKVGIGTDDPDSLLHLSGSAPRITLSDTAGTDDTGKIFSTGGVLYVQQRDDSSYGSIIFRTENNSTATQRFSINSAGVKTILNGNLNISSTYIDFSGDVSTPQTAAAIFRPADNTLAFSTANEEALRITSGGDVGIGTNDPNGANALTNNNALLAVGNLIATDATFKGNVTVEGTLTYDDVTNIDSVGLSTFQDGIHVVGGRESVGIGTTSVDAKLHIEATDDGNLFQLERSSGNTGKLTTTIGGADPCFNIITTGISSDISIRPGNGDGLIGINRLIPYARVDIAGGGTTDRKDVPLMVRNGTYGSDTEIFRIGRLDTGITGQLEDIRYHSWWSKNHTTDYENYVGLRVHSGGTDSPETDQIEVIRFRGDGRVGIGTDDPGYKLHVDGTVGATHFDSLSDRKLKTNIKTIENPIETVKKIDGVTFNWKENNEASMGVIAQNVEEVIPELISGEETKSVNYSGLIGLLIETVKDQQKQIDELKARLDK